MLCGFGNGRIYDGSRNTKPEKAGTAARSRWALWYNIKNALLGRRVHLGPGRFDGSGKEYGEHSCFGR